MSTLAFFILALMFRAGGMATQNRAPSAMRRSLDQGIVLTFFYWLLFIALTSTGSDGDGIMRGWMVILYPFILVAYVLLSSRETRDR
jgi:lipopolysaccharide export LptBFGC system permease protein LptF